MAALAVAEVSAEGVKRRPLIERNGTMLNTSLIQFQPGVFILFKELWLSLKERLAHRLEERRAQAELAVMTPRECFDLDVARGTLAWSEFARTSQRGDTNPTGH